MTISLSDAGKRFNRDWIFRHFNYLFLPGKAYAVTGSNGSGKSTLLQVLSGSMHFNEGLCNWELNGKAVAPENVYRYISICAPYLEIVEEMTMSEFFQFHHGFKPFLKGIKTADIINELGLQKASNKQMRYFSSGMKQRVKLAQCIFSDTPLMLLDEPCTNLDADGIALYHKLIKDFGTGRLIVVSSNDEVEYNFCEERIDMMAYKK